jgi:huntingtin-interacting protein 1-related protein
MGSEGQRGIFLLISHGRVPPHDDCAGYGPLIRTYVQFILAKLRFHRLRPEFNGLFEYEEYITLKGIDDPNEGYVIATRLVKPSPRHSKPSPSDMRLSQT